MPGQEPGAGAGQVQMLRRSPRADAIEKFEYLGGPVRAGLLLDDLQRNPGGDVGPIAMGDPAAENFIIDISPSVFGLMAATSTQRVNAGRVAHEDVTKGLQTNMRTSF